MTDRPDELTPKLAVVDVVHHVAMPDESGLLSMVSAGTPGSEQFERWREALSHLAMPVQVHSPHIADFTGTIDIAMLGEVTAILSRNRSVSLERNTSMIRRGDPETYVLVLNLHGQQGLHLGRDETVLSGGDMVLLHSSRRFSIEGDHARLHQSGCNVAIAPGLLGLPDTLLDRLIGRRLPGGDALVALVSRYLQALAVHGGALEAADGLRLAPLTIDMLAVMLARQLGTIGGLPPERRGIDLFIRIRNYILARLGDPSLAPEPIAAAHHISVRSLHRLFETHATTTLSRWILGRRLERLRADLADPTLHGRSVSALAMQWGFLDASHVSKAFKAAYGLTPTAFRTGHAGSAS
jgi:AraC-like DNA-binding protein